LAVIDPFLSNAQVDNPYTVNAGYEIDYMPIIPHPLFPNCTFRENVYVMPPG
jgi:hypothetical protein